jgi:arylsulfatase A-like enzyme
MRNEKVIEENPDQRQLTRRYTEDALAFINAQRDKPFFLYLAHAMPHVPLFVSEKHDGKSIRGLYGDVVMEVDWSVGRILECLEQNGIEHRTLVIFTSDNGPWLQYGIDGGSAGPLRNGKGSVYEGGMRVPAIFRWPGEILPGTRSEAVAGNLDLLPTIGAVAGAELPQDRVIDGRNLWPLLSGKTDESPHKYFHYFAGSGEGSVNYLGIRDERWKLLFSVETDGAVTSKALYDLHADPGERFDRLEDHPEIARELNAAARSFHAEMIQNLRPLGHQKEI